jgi:hypothetical protein
MPLSVDPLKVAWLPASVERGGCGPYMRKKTNQPADRSRAQTGAVMGMSARAVIGIPFISFLWIGIGLEGWFTCIIPAAGTAKSLLAGPEMHIRKNHEKWAAEISSPSKRHSPVGVNSCPYLLSAKGPLRHPLRTGAAARGARTHQSAFLTKPAPADRPSRPASAPPHNPSPAA